MNRFTNKEYLIDITIRTLETAQPPHPTKVKCEVHYADDSYLRIQIQPMLRNGLAQFCDQRLRIPFSPQVDLVFKLVKPNKKESFLGHYGLEVQKMLSEKQFSFKIKDKLEESDAWVDFQCRIIDKQLICESDTDQPELEVGPIADKSVVTWGQQTPKRLKLHKPLSQLNSPFVIVKKTGGSHMPMPPEQYGKMVQQAQDVLRKRQIFSQRQKILDHYTRDKYGILRTDKIIALQGRLNESRREKFINNLAIYSIIGLIAFLLGLQI